MQHAPPLAPPLQNPPSGAVQGPAAVGLEFPAYAYELYVDSDSGSGSDGSDSDANSAVDSSRSGAITTSRKSEVANYRYEHGRRYHAYSEGAYWLPNDEDEADRLDRQHRIWRLTLDGALHAAPISPDVQDVLDVGTGSGIWAIDFAKERPSAQVIGTDLSPIQPERVPPNVSFLVDDAESVWNFDGKRFDFIHARMLCLGMHDWGRFIQQCYDHLKPDGWLELHEIQFPIRCDDESVTEDSPLRKWSVLVKEAAAKGGIDALASDKFSRQMEERGFVNVNEQYLKWAVNTWPKGEKQKLVGRLQFENFNRGLQGFSLALLTKVLGWSKDSFDLFLTEVRNDITDRRRHYYWQITVHYAQKPFGDKVLDPASSS